jgi:hypothetical protein
LNQEICIFAKLDCVMFQSEYERVLPVMRMKKESANPRLEPIAPRRYAIFLLENIPTSIAEQKTEKVANSRKKERFEGVNRRKRK